MHTPFGERQWSPAASRPPAAAGRPAEGRPQGWIGDALLRADAGTRGRLAQMAQRSAGNAAVQRLLSVQRDGPFQLTAPTFAARPRASGPQLRLDPELEAHMRAVSWLRRELELERLRAHLLRLRPEDLDLSPDVFAGPPLATPRPLVTPGRGPDRSRTGSFGDLVAALAAPLAPLRQQLETRLLADWNRLQWGEQALVISAGTIIAAGALGGIWTDPPVRRTVLDLLNGQTVPVPGVAGLALELNTSGDNLMLGLHLDLGRFLPAELGFGPGSPRPIGSPPKD